MILAAILVLASSPFAAPATPADQSAAERAFRENYRSSAIESCVSRAKSAADAAGLDITPVCTCAADQLLATKSVEQLSEKVSDEEVRSITATCFKTNPPLRTR